MLVNCRGWPRNSLAKGGWGSDLMMDAFVGSFVHALGDQRFDLTSSGAAGRLVSTPDDLTAAGFRWHHVCGKNTTAYDLARTVTAKLADAGELHDIDAIVYSTALPMNGNVGDVDAWRSTRDIKYLMDFPGSRLQADFDLGDAAVIGVTQQGCTGLLGSLHLARALLAIEEDWQRVLCVTADRLPDGDIYEQAFNLLSDGAAGCVVSRRPGAFRIVAGHHITNGGLGGGGDNEAIGAFFTYVYRLVGETLRKAGLAPTDLDWVVGQNTNVTAWKILGRMLGIPLERIWLPSIGDAAHVISADNIINLQALEEARLVRPHHKLALVVAGHGLNWQCVILEATENI
jgi:3-oxoacyl-[acyl-carrier-protein] synthase-3